MKATIDAAGRIVVPKPLRQALGLKAGQPLEIRAGDGRLEIEIAPTPMRLKKRGKGGSCSPRRRTPRTHRRTGPRYFGARAALKAGDTSLIVAAFASWHESHEAARRALDGGLRLNQATAECRFSPLNRAFCCRKSTSKRSNRVFISDMSPRIK